MKKTLTASAVLMLGTAPLMAGGIERAPQSLGALFEPGNYVELSFGKVNPDVSGKDVAIFGGRDTGGVADDYGFVGFAYKQQLQDNLSVAFIVEQPYGADIEYPVGESVALGGTAAEVNSTTYTALLRYTMNNGFGVHGGLRGSRADGEVNLQGAAYGPLSGYNVKLDDDWAAGYVVGVSYEKPEIAARVSLTYNSDIEHEFDTYRARAIRPARAGRGPEGPGARGAAVPGRAWQSLWRPGDGPAGAGGDRLGRDGPARNLHRRRAGPHPLPTRRAPCRSRLRKPVPARAGKGAGRRVTGRRRRFPRANPQCRRPRVCGAFA